MRGDAKNAFREQSMGGRCKRTRGNKAHSDDAMGGRIVSGCREWQIRRGVFLRRSARRTLQEASREIARNGVCFLTAVAKNWPIGGQGETDRFHRLTGRERSGCSMTTAHSTRMSRHVRDSSGR
jgi:hypothetical protein